MPEYKYAGKAKFVDTLRKLSVEPNSTVTTKYILDNVPNFTRTNDNPPPYSDFTKDYILSAGQEVEIDKSVFEGLNSICASKVGDTDSNNNSIAYIYTDEENESTKNRIDNNSYVIIRYVTVRNIDKFILKADPNNQGNITVRVSFGLDYEV